MQETQITNWLAPSRSDPPSSQYGDSDSAGSIGTRHTTPLPGLHAVRSNESAISDASATSAPRALSSQPSWQHGGTVTNELKLFLADVATVQAEIAGISSVVAEYLAWMRTAPRGTRTTDMLQTLEDRLREIQGLANIGSLPSFEKLAYATQPQAHGMPTLRGYPGNMEEDSIRETEELDHFFREEYTVSLPLSDQRKSRRAGR